MIAAPISFMGAGPAPGQMLADATDEEVSPFGFPEPGADFETLSDFRLGNAVFRQEWTPAGEGAAHFDGLGPLFNARSCQSCHIRDGRGRPPREGGGAYAGTSMILKLARAGAPGSREQAPDPVYGHQLQDFALAGLAPEGRVRVEYEEQVFAFADGEEVRLRRPRFTLAAPAFGPLAKDAVASARIAPPMIGLGLVQRIAEADIIAGADAQDRDGDGISGRANIVEEGNGLLALGRFGWKAGQPRLEAQIALAFSRDMGVSTARLPEGAGDCTAHQQPCIAAPDGNSPEFENVEAHSTIIGWLVAYAGNLAVPPARNMDHPDIVAGQAIFAEIGCTRCHRPAFATAPDADQPHLGGRQIAPYSDFLLHDMGAGLDDGFGEGRAEGAEWRTAPLWGIGLTGEVNANAFFLHDGRAQSLLQAILWHGGEAEAAREAFAGLAKAERDRLIAFLKAL